MGYKLSAARIILAIILVNAVGFTLKYFDLDTHIIFLGFRFHIAAVIPFLTVIKKDHFNLINESFRKPQFVRIGNPLFAFITINILFILILLLFKKIEIGDPDYFYEFGLSSIVDYPVYLVWNSIQLIMFYFFLLNIQKSIKYSFVLALAVSMLILAYEFIPLNKIVLDYGSTSAFMLQCLVVAFTLKYFNNIYLFCFLIFSTIWINVLAFGSSSSTLVNIFFAANYNSWEGFFSVDKSISDFIIPANYLLLLVGLIALSIINKRKSA